MWRLIQILFFGHSHKWKIIEHSPLERNYHPFDGGGLAASGERYILQCETCGNIKQRDVI